MLQKILVLSQQKSMLTQSFNYLRKISRLFSPCSVEWLQIFKIPCLFRFTEKMNSNIYPIFGVIFTCNLHVGNIYSEISGNFLFLLTV